jgi:transposase
LLALEGRPTLADAPALTEPYNEDLSSLRPSKGGPVTDTADAVSVAQAALHNPMLRVVTAEDQTTILRLLAERRDDLAAERTRILNRLHGLLRDLVPGGASTT